jgi:hypothetical protein
MTMTLYKWEYRRQRRAGRNPIAAAWIAFWWAIEPPAF